MALRLALGELEPFAGAGLTGLFTFLHAGVAREEPLLFEWDADRLVNLKKRAAQSEAHGASLAVDSAAGRLDDDVVGVDSVRDLKRTKDLVLKREAAEIIGKVAAVDFDGPGAGLHAQAGN